MKTNLSITIAFIFLCGNLTILHSQERVSQEASAQDSKASSNMPIATVDVLKLFNTYKPVLDKMEALKREVKELEGVVAIRQVEIDALQRRLQTPNATNEERERMQLQLSKLQTELRLFVERERSTLQKRESAIQVAFYKQVKEIIARISKERGLKLVLVRPELSVESENLAEAQRALNAIILYEEGLEITADVLKILNEALASKKPE
jgi:Skp family chaperone for outer membrane proteins